MTLKDLAIAAAAEQARHEAEQQRIYREQGWASFTTEATNWVTATFAAPDEFIIDQRVYGYHQQAHVRWDNDWFEITSNPMGLRPSEPCPTQPGEWHYVDASSFSVRSDQKICTLIQLGHYLTLVERAEHGGPNVGRCRFCDQAFGTATDTKGNLWVGVPTHLGDLPRMAAEFTARDQEG